MKKVVSIMLMSVFCSLFISNSFAEGLTREQIKEELRIARLNGELNRNSEDYPQIPFVSTKTREQVKEELIEYRKSHPIQNEYFF